MKPKWIALIVIGVVAIVFCVIPLKDVGPHIVNCTIYSSLTFNSSGYVRSENQQDIASVLVENTDDTAGNFTVFFFGFEPLLGNSSRIAMLPLDAGQTKIAECAAEFINDWHYYVISGTKRTPSQWEVGRQKVTLLYWFLHHQLICI
jgi:hypothetical protein